MEAVLNNRRLFAFASLASILLTLWAIYVDPIVNPDALLYLSAAEEFSQGNIKNGLAIYKWPFYSILISITHSITGLSVQSSAYFLNACMHVLIVLGFLACVHRLGASKRTLLIAALIILLFPSLNKYRAFIIRDAGFIAFYLWSIYFLILAIETKKIHCFLWSFLFIICATLFRIEAIAILAIIPWFLLYIYSDQKYKFFWLCGTIFSSIVIFFGISIWLFGEYSLHINGDIWGFLSASIQFVADNLDFKLETIRRHILNDFSKQFAPTVLIVSVTVIVIYETLRRLSFIFAYFSWYAIKTKLVLEKKQLRHTFYVLCSIQLALLFLFALINLFLVSRHTLALCLTVLLLAPFSINYFYEKWLSTRSSNEKTFSKFVLPFVACVLLLAGLDGLDVKSNKLGIKESGVWLEQQVDSSYSLYSNSSLVLHYANRKPAYFNLNYNWEETNALLVTNQIFNFDYAAILLSENHDASKSYINKQLDREPVSEKLNQDNHLLLIYDLREISPGQKLDDKYFKIR